MPQVPPSQAPPSVGSQLVDDPFKIAVRNITVLAALVAYVFLASYVIWQTWKAKAGAPPDIANVQSAALGALAVTLGAGYAVILGVPPRTESAELVGLQGWKRFKKWISSQSTGIKLLGAGVLAYLIVGMAIAATYAFNEAETPGVLSTIAIGFGGYVLAYIGAAYQKMSE